MTEHVLVKGVEAHQLPMEPSHDVGILNLIMTAWNQLTPDEVDTVYMYYQEFAPWEFWALVLLFIYSYSHFAGHLFTAPSKLKFPMYFQKVYSTSTGNILSEFGHNDYLLYILYLPMFQFFKVVRPWHTHDKRPALGIRMRMFTNMMKSRQSTFDTTESRLRQDVLNLGGTRSVSMRFAEGTNVTSGSVVPLEELGSQMWEEIQDMYNQRVQETRGGQKKKH